MAAENFARALAEVLRHEGGYVDHPRDPGGATNLGITLATLSRHRGRAVTKAEVRALTRAEAAEIYRGTFWNAVAGDRLPAGIDLAVFDYAVNSGPRRAVAAVQRVAAAPASGVMDSVTLQMLAKAGRAEIVKALTRQRLGFLHRLPIWPVFGRGWARRVIAVERSALLMAGTGGKPLPKLQTANPPPAKNPTPAANPTSTVTTKPRSDTMVDTKSVLRSRTIWANAFGLAALLLPAFGFNLAGVDPNALIETGAQVLAGGSFIASTLFRIVASRRLV